MLQSQQWRFEHHVPISRRESANTTLGSLYCKYELPSPPHGPTKLVKIHFHLTRKCIRLDDVRIMLLINEPHPKGETFKVEAPVMDTSST